MSKVTESAVYKAVLDALQGADEIAASMTTDEYVELMDAVIAVATERRERALVENPPECADCRATVDGKCWNHGGR